MITQIVTLAISYLVLVQYFRHRRIKKITKQLGYEGLSSAEIYKKISITDAQLIQNNMVLLEFPRIYHASLQFALFKTYAFPSMSGILVKTRQLVDDLPSPKRYVDTVVLIAEFMRWPLDSERASLAIARTNYIHAQHPAVKNQPNGFLYTLLLFPVEPLKFISMYEWRKPTELEKAAVWKFWYEIGIRMNIPAETIPKTWDEMAAWTEKFESDNMTPAKTNNMVGKKTVELLLWWVPRGAPTTFAKDCVYALLGEPLREAMMFPKFHPAIPYIVSAIFGLRKFVLRHLCLPRTVPVEKLFEKPNPETGLYQATCWDVEPWYMPATGWNKWGPWAWIAWVGGWPMPTKGKYMEGGYRIADIGPKGIAGRGREKVEAEAEKIRMMGIGRSACPFQ